MNPAGPLLGAIIAGGSARRFGADKGAALLNGVALLDHISIALRPQVDHLIIVGREWPGLDSVGDAPAPHMGPLGGLNAALIYAQECGYRAVLTAGCDTLPIPENLVAHLGSGPAVLKDHFLFGVWPAGCVDALSAHLSMQSDHALRGWIALSRARVVPAPCSFVNLNTQQDLAAYAASLNSSSVGLQ